MWDWVAAHKGLIFTLSAAGFVATLMIMVVLIVRMPDDYFLHPREAPWAKSRPVLRVLLVIVRNLLGAALLLLGLVMLATPGQGVLSILVGISLLDVPGKRRLELAIIRREPVRKSMNWIREKAGRPPLQLPPKDQDESDS
jgi:hypothetical protein